MHLILILDIFRFGRADTSNTKGLGTFSFWSGRYIKHEKPYSSQTQNWLLNLNFLKFKVPTLGTCRKCCSSPTQSFHTHEFLAPGTPVNSPPWVHSTTFYNFGASNPGSRILLLTTIQISSLKLRHLKSMAIVHFRNSHSKINFSSVSTYSLSRWSSRSRHKQKNHCHWDPNKFVNQTGTNNFGRPGV